MNANVSKLLNEQINKEFYSAKGTGAREAGHRQHRCHLRRRIRGKRLPRHADAGLVH